MIVLSGGRCQSQLPTPHLNVKLATPLQTRWLQQESIPSQWAMNSPVRFLISQLWCSLSLLIPLPWEPYNFVASVSPPHSFSKTCIGIYQISSCSYRETLISRSFNVGHHVYVPPSLVLMKMTMTPSCECLLLELGLLHRWTSTS